MSDPIIDPRLSVVYRPQVEEAANPAAGSIAPLLELGLAQTNSQGAYLYRFNAANDALELLSWKGQRPAELDAFRVQLSSRADAWYREIGSAVTLEREAWSDWRFERFPEFLLHRFEAVFSIPLIEAGRAVGIANIARTLATPFGTREADFLRSLSLPLGSLVAESAKRKKLESELEELAQKLADRKVVERAKGLLQAQNSWTEEESYLYLRRTSRQTRTPMREIARAVIDGRGNQPVPAASEAEPSR